MGIALSTLSSLPRLLRASRRWLRDASAVDHVSFHSGKLSALPLQQAAADSQAPATPGTTTPDRPRDAPRHRPVRGNWPFTAGAHLPSSAQPLPVPGHEPHDAKPGLVLRRKDAGDALRRSAVRNSVGAAAPASKALRVVRKTSVSDAGRLVIAGRMADVCAELDRMAASEAALRAC
jgi:hypothetical protein